MRALVLVDLQNDFLPGGALAVPDGDQVIPIANRVQLEFEWIVATQDWHPAHHLSFAANHANAKIGDVIQLDGRSQILWPVHCVQGTQGAEVASNLDRSRFSAVIHKGVDPRMDSYSGFFDNGHQQATGLEEFLRSKQIRLVYIMGLATDYCVKFTAIDARQLGFDTRLIIDGCRGVNLRSQDSQDAVQEMKNAGVEVVTSDAI